MKKFEHSFQRIAGKGWFIFS